MRTAIHCHHARFRTERGVMIRKRPAFQAIPAWSVQVMRDLGLSDHMISAYFDRWPSKARIALMVAGNHGERENRMGR